MATFKWNIIAGSTVPTNVNGTFGTITIAASADGVRPSNAAYFAKEGDDTTGNGSRLYPCETPERAAALISGGQGVAIGGAGTYRITTPISIGNALGKTFISDVKHQCIIDLTGQPSFIATAGDASSCFSGMTFRNAATNVTATTSHLSALDCRFENCTTPFAVATADSNRRFVGCEFHQVLVLDFSIPAGAYGYSFSGNTFNLCRDIRFRTRTTGTVGSFNCIDNVFSKSNIWVQGISGFNFEYSIASTDCNWRFNATQGTAPTALPPTVPSGYVNYTTIGALVTAYNAAFSTTAAFTNSMVADPLLNDPTNGDLSPSFTSPADNLKYNGYYAGTRGPTRATNLNTLISSTNITNNSGILSPTTDAIASFVTKIIKLDAEYELDQIPFVALMADRNGEVIDFTNSLASSTIAAGSSVLTADTPYVVEGSSVTLTTPSLTVTPPRKVVPIAGQTSFSSAGGGVMREVLQAPNRYTVGMRVKSAADTPITSASALTANAHYYVVSGSVTHDGNTYNANDSFDAGAVTSFTGAGTVEKVFDPSDAFFPYIAPSTPIRCNRVGNVGTGAISKGNGDPTFDTATANQFRLFAVYVQYYLILQTDGIV
jgi:hypothetical protein